VTKAERQEHADLVAARLERTTGLVSLASLAEELGLTEKQVRYAMAELRDRTSEQRQHQLTRYRGFR
jgi:biotin operon repressor